MQIHKVLSIFDALQSVAELGSNCGPCCRRACLNSEITSEERGGIMKSGTRGPGTGFICSTLAIHKPLEQAPAALFSLRLSRLWQTVTGSLCFRSGASMRSAAFMVECFVLGCGWHSVRAESVNPHRGRGGAQVFAVKTINSQCWVDNKRATRGNCLYYQHPNQNCKWQLKFCKSISSRLFRSTFKTLCAKASTMKGD